MKISSTWIAVMLLLTGLASAQTQSREVRNKEYNLKRGVALAGYDPVSYLAGKPMEGNEQLSQVHDGITYLFSSTDNRDLFRKNPSRYEPAYGGWCAYAMGATGEKVKVDPETFKIIGDRLYLFYNFWGNNTLETWNKDEVSLRRQADLNWKKFAP